MAKATSFKFLPLTLSIETLGGLSTPLVRRGTLLPTRRTQRFSTSTDNQKAVTIVVYLGESSVAKNNILVSQCELSVPEAPRGEPEIYVTFDVDEQCKVKITAIEKKTGKQICSEIESPSPHLTKEKVDEMLAKCAASWEMDAQSAGLIEARNKAMNLLSRAEKYLQERQKYGLSNSADVQIDEVVASIGILLETNDLPAIIAKTERLEELLPKSTFGSFEDLFKPGMFDDIFGTPVAKQRRPSIPSPRGTQDKGTEDTLSAKQKISNSVELAKSDKGIFSAGQYFDAKQLVRDLFANAEKEITVIDAYVGEDVLSLLTVKRHGVVVKILTGKTSAPFLTLARDFNRQYKGIEVRSSKAFHDRFVIIDQKDHYHFGASLEHLGNKTFMFSKIEEPTMIEVLQKHWQQVWDQATKRV
jgi:hypothetical protein